MIQIFKTGLHGIACFRRAYFKSLPCFQELYLERLAEASDYYDIGMWVNPRFRKKGIATGIISGLKRICLQNHRIPVCGCLYDNLGSKRTLEKNGFVSKYRIAFVLHRGWQP